MNVSLLAFCPLHSALCVLPLPLPFACLLARRRHNLASLQREMTHSRAARPCSMRRPARSLAHTLHAPRTRHAHATATLWACAPCVRHVCAQPCVQKDPTMRPSPHASRLTPRCCRAHPLSFFLLNDRKRANASPTGWRRLPSLRGCVGWRVGGRRRASRCATR